MDSSQSAEYTTLRTRKSNICICLVFKQAQLST